MTFAACRLLEHKDVLGQGGPAASPKPGTQHVA